MAKVSREILKSYFQSGGRPTSAHFESLIESLLHYSEDRDMTGLKKYNPNNYYAIGDACLHNSCIFEALAETSGEFNSLHWNQISTLQPAQPVLYGLGAGGYLLSESNEESFMNDETQMADKVSISTESQKGVFRLSWSAVVHHQTAGGMGRFRLINKTDSTVIGSSLVIKQNNTSERIPVGGIAKVLLDGISRNYALQYQTLNDGSSQYIQDAKIELIKISD